MADTSKGGIDLVEANGRSGKGTAARWPEREGRRKAMGDGHIVIMANRSKSAQFLRLRFERVATRWEVHFQRKWWILGGM